MSTAEEASRRFFMPVEGHPSLFSNASIYNHDNQMLTPSSPLLQSCLASLEREQRRSRPTMPALRIDPLSPLPLADAARQVGIVYFIMASRSYSHETINRNVVALQRPQRRSTLPNETNLFLLHIDAKMSAENAAALRSRLDHRRPDVYVMREPRAVLWSGFSMALALLDAMASVLARPLGFEYFINLSDADLTLRTDGEIRAFFARFPGRSVMSIVPPNVDPGRYRMHKAFRKWCWVECDGGTGWVVRSQTPKWVASSPAIFGRKTCCWSRSAPIVYSRQPTSCRSSDLSNVFQVFHGSQ